MVKERERDKESSWRGSGIGEASHRVARKRDNRQECSKDRGHQDQEDRAEEQTHCESAEEKNQIAEKTFEIQENGGREWQC